LGAEAPAAELAGGTTGRIPRDAPALDEAVDCSTGTASNTATKQQQTYVRKRALAWERRACIGGLY